jgi:hypothetical protein
MREPIPLRSWLRFAGFALVMTGLGLVIACGFQPPGLSRRYLAAFGLLAIALGGAGLIALEGRFARDSVKSWTGPAAVAFVVGGPLLVGFFVWLLKP